MVLTAPTPLSVVHQRIRQSAQCTAAAGYYQLSFRAMSTQCRVNFRTLRPSDARDFQHEVLSWVAWFEATYSRFIDDSVISRINRAAGREWVELDPETDRILELCGDMYRFTRGVFDPTALPLIRLWNWKAEQPVIPDEAAIRDTLALVGWRRVQRRPGAIHLPLEGMCLDLGGIGKEYAVDSVIESARQRGIEHALVDFGNDVRVVGEPPERGAWHIGLEDPRNPGQCWTGVGVRDAAVATSGDYLRHFSRDGRRYGHILDPRTGRPVANGCLSVTVIAPHCTGAGVLSTAAFVLGPQEGIGLISLCPGFEGSIISDHAQHETRKFHAYRTR